MKNIQKNTIRTTIPILALAAMLRPCGETAVLDEPKIKEAPPLPEASGTETIKLKDLIIDADTQNRVTIDQETVEHYLEIVKQAKKDEQPIPFPALSAVRCKSGKAYLWDGFHRIDALKKAHETEYPVDLYDAPEGWDALEYAQLLSLSANATHGKQRTNKDIARAVKNAMANPTIAAWSNTIIANWVGVSEGTVRNYRPAVGATTTRLAKRGGKTVQVNTKNIGKKGGKTKPEPKKKGKPAKEEKKGSASTAAAKSAGEKVDADLRNAILKISGSLSPDSLSAQVRKALDNDGMGLSRPEILAWAQTSKDRIQSIVHLVLDLEMKPTKAYAFLDKEIAGNTSLDSFLTLLLTAPKRRERHGNGELVFGQNENGENQLVITLKKKK